MYLLKLGFGLIDVTGHEACVPDVRSEELRAGSRSGSQLGDAKRQNESVMIVNLTFPFLPCIESFCEELTVPISSSISPDIFILIGFCNLN